MKRDYSLRNAGMTGSPTVVLRRLKSASRLYCNCTIFAPV